MPLLKMYAVIDGRSRIYIMKNCLTYNRNQKVKAILLDHTKNIPKELFFIAGHTTNQICNSTAKDTLADKVSLAMKLKGTSLKTLSQKETAKLLGIFIRI